ncbi:MAG: hypothetical protein ACRYG2_15025 [Janthinobacterium lividum]
MSALQAAPKPIRKPSARSGERVRPALRPLATPGRRMARLPFLIVLIAAFGLGMAGLLLLNTTLQNQEFEARRLNSQASQLTYVQDDLESQLQTVSSPGSLAQKAYDLRMRPNVHAAFLVLPDGTVKGDAETTKGTEMRYLQPGAGERLTTARAATEAAKKAAQAAKAAAADPTPAPAPAGSTSAQPTATSR